MQGLAVAAMDSARRASFQFIRREKRRVRQAQAVVAPDEKVKLWLERSHSYTTVHSTILLCFCLRND